MSKILFRGKKNFYFSFWFCERDFLWVHLGLLSSIASNNCSEKRAHMALTMTADGIIDSIDEHTDVLDEVTMTKVRWRVKGSVMPDEDTWSSNTSKHSRQLPSQTVKPLEPIKALSLGKGVTSVALTTHNG